MEKEHEYNIFLSMIIGRLNGRPHFNMMVPSNIFDAYRHISDHFNLHFCHVIYLFDHTEDGDVRQSAPHFFN